tara:strand:- start:16657 stop:16974 length:318 start_codon:yes stop_codon:yes gene_type:complete
MSSRPVGHGLQPITAKSGDQLVREIQQFSSDVSEELEARKLFVRRDSQRAYLVQMDTKGRLVWYCRQSVAGKTVWRKVAEIDSDGDVRIRGTLTQNVVFDVSEDL